MTADSPEGTKTAAQLLREVAERDPEAHKRALARAYGCGAESSDTAIGSPAFEAAKETAQERGWVMEPSVISAMLAAAFGPLLERLDQQTAEIERLRADPPLPEWVEMLTNQSCENGRHSDWFVDSEYHHACPWCALTAAQARAEAWTVENVAAALRLARLEIGSVGGQSYREHVARIVIDRISALAGDAARPKPQERPRCLTPTNCAIDAYPCMVGGGCADDPRPARPLPEPEQPRGEYSESRAAPNIANTHLPSSSFGYAYCAVCRADWPCHAAKEQA